jgi:AraC-like DNA-binding protein
MGFDHFQTGQGLPDFVSRQVTQARRYFFDLRPQRDRALALVCGGCERVKGDYGVERSSFPFHCVELVAEGEGDVLLDGELRQLRPGVVFAYGPRTKHRIRSSAANPMLKYYVDFCGWEAERLLAAAGLGGSNALRVTPVEEVVDLFESIQRDSSSEHPAAPEICELFLRLVLLKIRERTLPAREGETRAFATYKRARALLEQNALKWSTVGEAASVCGIAPETLSRLFRRYAHTNPHLFMRRRKMSRAAEMLLDAGLKVSVVAAELGFSEPSHFSRSFKQVYGVSPERFVREVKGANKGEASGVQAAVSPRGLV